MPVVGFTDDLGHHYTFKDVLGGRGWFSVPRTVVRVLALSYRDTAAHYDAAAEERLVSVTELLSPIQQRVLRDRHDVYVRPLDNLWAMFGTVAHEILEKGAQASEECYVEKKIKVELAPGLQLGGTVDLLERREDGRWEGRDYKVTSAYKVKKMMTEGVKVSSPEYHWQGNVYAWLARQKGYNVDSWGLVLIVRDYNARQHGAYFQPVCEVSIELEHEHLVKKMLRERATLLEAARMATDETLPPCTSAETWGTRRCQSYCEVSKVCHQWNAAALAAAS